MSGIETLSKEIYLTTNCLPDEADDHARHYLAAIEPHIQEREREAKREVLDHAIYTLYVTESRHLWPSSYTRDSLQKIRDDLEIEQVSE